MKELDPVKQKAIKDAQLAIDAICDELGVMLVPQMMIVQGQIVNHSVGIVPKPEESRIIMPEMRKDVEEKIASNPKGE